MELNTENIHRCVARLKDLDLSNASLADISDILTPLFAGYRVRIPVFQPGVYLYRSRICKNKPIYLSELSYPPQKVIKEYGRANDIGESIFYGSISKNIPFYELDAKQGDNLVVSIWKTNSDLIVNHIGFSKEVFLKLRSERKWEDIYKFVSDTHHYNDLNTFVHNFLAATFTKKVPHDQNDLYKLTVALTHKMLAADFLHGLLYPTIPMQANSDNIAIKPGYVDKHMEFVAAEYHNVDEASNGKYRSTVLDSVVEHENGKLNWSGKYLGWTMEPGDGLNFKSDGSAWIAINQNALRMNPKPTGAIKLNVSAQEKLFEQSFLNCYKYSKEIVVKTAEPILTIRYSLALNFKNKSRFLMFYFPFHAQAQEIIKSLVVQCEQFLLADSEELIECRSGDNQELICTNKDLLFNNEIHIFLEQAIDQILTDYKLIIHNDKSDTETIRYV